MIIKINSVEDEIEYIDVNSKINLYSVVKEAMIHTKTFKKVLLSFFKGNENEWTKHSVKVTVAIINTENTTFKICTFEPIESLQQRINKARVLPLIVSGTAKSAQVISVENVRSNAIRIFNEMFLDY